MCLVSRGQYIQAEIVEISIDKLKPFFISTHPFKTYANEKKEELKASIDLNGLINPIIVRHADEDVYEIISGHNRVIACKELNLQSIACIVLELTDEEAILMMTDANLNQRQSLLPSEKAKAYSLKIDTLKLLNKPTSFRALADEDATNKDEIRRYYRLSFLINDLLENIDKMEITVLAGVELSYLHVQEQEELSTFIKKHNCKVSFKHADSLRKQSKKGSMDFNILLSKSNKKASANKIIDLIEVTEYFSEDMTVDEIKEAIMSILSLHFKALE